MVGRAATVDGATLDDFDALCAHLATMHPSRYLTLIDGVTMVTSGARLDGIFSDEMLAGGYRKKYLRAISRLLALTADVSEVREP